MTRQEQITEFIRTGRSYGRSIISAQFEMEWVAQSLGKESADWEDYLHVSEMAGVDNFIGLWKDYGDFLPSLRWRETDRKTEGDADMISQKLETPVGTLTRVIEQKIGQVVWVPDAPVRTETDFAVVEWYAHEVMSCVDAVAEELRQDMAVIDGRLPASFVVLLPFEMYYMIGYADMPMMYIDYPEAYHRAMDAIHDTNKSMIKAALKVGVPLVSMGSAGYELLSPTIFREALLPYAKDICAFIREEGGLSYYHMCGHSLEIARSGLFNEIHPDVLETLSPPPCGVVTDLAEARSFIDGRICTRGNLPVELLHTGPVDLIAEEARKLARLTHGWKHIFGVSDTLLPGTPLEHVRAMSDAARSVEA